MGKKAAKSGAPDEALITDEWMTPKKEFAEWHDEFNFTVDAAADERTHQLPIWFGPGGIEPDGLLADWSQHRSIWCNMPFSNIGPWVAKAWSAVAPGQQRPATIVLLTPATKTEQPWWSKRVEPFRDSKARALLDPAGITFETRFVEGRTKFVAPPRVKTSGPRFGACLLIWRTTSLPRTTLSDFIEPMMHENLYANGNEP